MSCLGKGDISLKISVLKWYRKPISCNTTEKRFSMMGVWSEWHYCLDFVPSVMLQGSRQPTFPALQSHICWCWKLGKRVSVYWRVLQSAVCNLLLTWIECRGNMISQVRAKNNSLTTWSYMTNTGRVPYFWPSSDVCIHFFIKWFIKRHKVITSKAPFFPRNGRRNLQYSLHIPTEGWPGWVCLDKYWNGRPTEGCSSPIPVLSRLGMVDVTNAVAATPTQWVL